MEIVKRSKFHTAFIFFVWCLLLVFHAPAQNTSSPGKVTGSVTDTKTSQPLQFATVGLYSVKDSVFSGGGVSDSAGHFSINGIPVGLYYLKVSFVGYDFVKTKSFGITSSQSTYDLGSIQLIPSAALLKTATVEAKQLLVQQNGDTTQYNANAYKTHPDASAEDLITKMPGVSSENGTVKVNGEQVQQVLVDGKPFFGDDANAALKNLPAEIIDKIQVFDKLSDQSQFTGFDDGQSSKTINIVTKPGKNNGLFGKHYAGYGENDRYIAGISDNYFKGERRISLIGLTNNINQQNFTSQDLAGITGSSAGGGAGRGGRGGGGGAGGAGGQGGANPASNFLTNQQNGIQTTNAIGLNYTDKWGKSIKVTGSYFFNEADNLNSGNLQRNYITGATNGLFYNENSRIETDNYNHRFNLRFEYTIDSANSLIVSPKLNFQTANSSSAVTGNTTLAEGVAESKSTYSTGTDNSAYSFSNSILFRHKFEKRGRTFSFNLSNDLGNKNGTSNLYSLSDYYFLNNTTRIDQHANQQAKNNSVGLGLVYTEPIDSFSQLQFNYSPSSVNGNTDKATYNYNDVETQYNQLDTALSNKYESTYLSNKGGIAYRRSNRKYNLMAGLNFQEATLQGEEHFPISFTVKKTFSDALPQGMFNYRFSRGTNLRIIYRTSTNIPSITQLQSVINNSNPLLLSTGNPDLKQDYGHTLTLRYGKSNAEKASGLFLFLVGNYTMNYISNATFIPTKDSVLREGIVLKKGSQLTKPVNLNGYANARTLITYVFPVTAIKCNLNFNAGVSYTRSPGLINNVENLSNNYALNGGLGISSNISENIDFSLSTSANYNIVKNTLQGQANNNYFSQSTSFKLNWIFLDRVVFNTSLNHTYYNGLSQSYNQNFVLWNSSLGYKFLKDKSIELKVSIFDILAQNSSINRTVTETYIEDSKTNVLSRYFMVTFTYNLRKFKVNEPKTDGAKGRRNRE